MNSMWLSDLRMSLWYKIAYIRFGLWIYGFLLYAIELWHYLVVVFLVFFFICLHLLSEWTLNRQTHTHIHHTLYSTHRCTQSIKLAKRKNLHTLLPLDVYNTEHMHKLCVSYSSIWLRMFPSRMVNYLFLCQQRDKLAATVYCQSSNFTCSQIRIFVNILKL